MALDERIRQLYTDIQREYDLTLERRRNLTSQATNIMAFTGIIQSVLIAVIVTLATDKDSQTVLMTSKYYHIILGLGGIAFISYIVTSVFSLLAFWEPKWFRVPRMPDNDPIKSIQTFFLDPVKYNLEKFAIQLSKATQLHQLTNRSKYQYLRFAMLSLMVGIVATLLGGFCLLLNLI
jgi:hypothetical protein